MIYFLGLLGIAAFSITGVIAAGRRGMDIFSIVLLGVVTALGGGTLRDMILVQPQVFWIADLSYLWVAIGASILAFFGIRLFTYLYPLLLYIDAFGLALFTVLAIEKTLLLGFVPTVAIIMGLITGITGGMVRDILTGRMPLLLGKEFYATPALIGAILFVLCRDISVGPEMSRLIGITTILLLRVLAIKKGMYYPGWLTFKGSQE